MTGEELRIQLILLKKTQKELTKEINKTKILKADTAEVNKALADHTDPKHFKIREVAEQVIAAWHDERRKGRL